MFNSRDTLEKITQQLGTLKKQQNVIIEEEATFAEIEDLAVKSSPR